MASLAERIITELNDAVAGDPWHGDSVAKILDGMTSDEAARRRVRHGHTIWEIVRHMTAWTNEVGRRLAGHPAAEPEEGDWPAVPAAHDDAAWRADVSRFFTAHRMLTGAIQPLSDEELIEPTRDPRNRETGTGVTREVLLHGLAQHHAYHAGQISLLKKA